LYVSRKMSNIGGFDASDVAGRLSRYLPNAPTTGPSGVGASDAISNVGNELSDAYNKVKGGISDWYNNLSSGMRGSASNPALGSTGVPTGPSGAPVVNGPTGAPIGTVAGQPNPPVYTAPQTNPGTVITQATTTKNTTSWWYWLLLILILVVIGYIIWRLAGGHSSSKSATGNVPVAYQPVNFKA
jgi:hypothetical protein